MAQVSLADKIDSLRQCKRQKKRAERLVGHNWEASLYHADLPNVMAKKIKVEPETDTNGGGGESGKKTVKVLDKAKRKANKEKNDQKKDDFCNKLEMLAPKPRKVDGFKQENPVETMHRPMSEFLASRFHTKVKPVEDLKKDIVNDLGVRIDAVIQNVVKPDPDNRSKRTRDLDAFYRGEQIIAQPFGLDDPNHYPLFRKLKAEEQAQEERGLTQGRSQFVNFGKNKKTALFQEEQQELDWADLPEITPSYVADFTREVKPHSKERPCRNGLECIFNTLPIDHPTSMEDLKPEDCFISREFLLPKENEAFLQSGALPEEFSLCLGCNRFVTSALYQIHIDNHTEPIECLQDHRYAVEGEDAYPISACLYPDPNPKKFTGITRPFVKFRGVDWTFEAFYDKESKTRLKRAVERIPDF